MTRRPSHLIDIAEISSLAAELVRIPSRADTDSPAQVLAFVSSWLTGHSLDHTMLDDSSRGSVGVFVAVQGKAPGCSLCLNACVDTAPFGDVSRWLRPPLSGEIQEGRLWGRGSADSKVGAALLMLLARHFAAAPPERGTVFVLLDADEHTGRFGGIKAFLEACSSKPDAMVLGYPGHDSLIVGARGFLRVNIRVLGAAAHSGSINSRGINAIGKLSRLIVRLETTPLTDPAEAEKLGPSLTVTEVSGGEGFSQVPDCAIVGVDIRLTESFDMDAATAWLARVLRAFDDEEAGPRTAVEQLDHWPAYQVPSDHRIVRCLLGSAKRNIGREIPTEICGPSNIGNLLSTRGVPTICGLGVGYENLHAANECAVLGDLPMVAQILEEATRDFLER